MRPSLLYHKIQDNPELGITRTTHGGFQRQMDYLNSKGFKCLSIEASENDDSAPDHPPIVTLSFDDGYESVFENAFPILQELNFSATVFLPSAYIGKNNDWDHGRFGIKYRHMGVA